MSIVRMKNMELQEEKQTNEKQRRFGPVSYTHLPSRMADRILGMGDVLTLIEQAQDKMDMEASKKTADRLMQGTFTLDDMLVQYQQIKKMGSLGGMMKTVSYTHLDVYKRQDPRDRHQFAAGGTALHPEFFLPVHRQ